RASSVISFLCLARHLPGSTLFPYTTLFRSWAGTSEEVAMSGRADDVLVVCPLTVEAVGVWWGLRGGDVVRAGMRARRRSAVLAALRQRPEVPVVVAGGACAPTSAPRPGGLGGPDVGCAPRGAGEVGP